MNIKKSYNLLNEGIQKCNSNKYFVGIAMIIFNIGSKFIIMDMSTSYQNLLKGKIARRLTLFSIFFIATKDIYVSLVLTAVFVVISTGLFNENSKYCILPSSFTDNVYTKEEYEIALKIVKGYEKKKTLTNK